MESRWRQNIPDLGFSFAEWHLCARLLGGPYAGYWIWQHDGAPDYGVIGYPAVFSSGEFYVNVVGGPYYGRFPYGMQVEADSS